jgi:hypothetical protein
MRLSWFIPQNDKYIRVEEEILEFSERFLIFIKNKKHYKLRGLYNLKEILIDDILYAYQIKDTLYPIQGCPIYNPELNVSSYKDVNPEKLKELIEKSKINMQNEIDKIKELIKYQLQKNAEDDYVKINFLQEIDSYRNKLYRKFIEFLKNDSDEFLSKKDSEALTDSTFSSQNSIENEIKWINPQKKEIRLISPKDNKN